MIFNHLRLIGDLRSPPPARLPLCPQEFLATFVAVDGLKAFVIEVINTSAIACRVEFWILFLRHMMWVVTERSFPTVLLHNESQLPCVSHVTMNSRLPVPFLEGYQQELRN